MRIAVRALKKLDADASSDFTGRAARAFGPWVPANHTGLDNLRYFAELYSVPPRDQQRRIVRGGVYRRETPRRALEQGGDALGDVACHHPPRKLPLHPVEPGDGMLIRYSFEIGRLLGPAQVFAELQEIELPSATYSLSYLSTSGGLVPTDVGMMIDTAPISSVRSNWTRSATSTRTFCATAFLPSHIMELTNFVTRSEPYTGSGSTFRLAMYPFRGI